MPRSTHAWPFAGERPELVRGSRHDLARLVSWHTAGTAGMVFNHIPGLSPCT